MNRIAETTNKEIPNRNEPKKKKINPFSVAKFFYENEIVDIAIIQKMIYLTFLEVLEKENLLLDFGEDFQAWPRGPILETVFFGMIKCWKECGNYEKFFNKFPSLDDEIIIRHCQGWVIYYHKIEKKKQQYKISEKSRNQPWMIARDKVNGYLENEKIDLNDIINFARQEGSFAERKRLRT